MKSLAKTLKLKGKTEAAALRKGLLLLKAGKKKEAQEEFRIAFARIANEMKFKLAAAQILNVTLSPKQLADDWLQDCFKNLSSGE